MRDSRVSRPPHPNQPIVFDENGTARFKQNSIVRFLLEAGQYDLNFLALADFDQDDWNQFAQLLGYSVSGFGDLPYADPERVSVCYAEVERLREARQ